MPLAPSAGTKSNTPFPMRSGGDLESAHLGRQVAERNPGGDGVGGSLHRHEVLMRRRRVGHALGEHHAGDDTRLGHRGRSQQPPDEVRKLGAVL